jgi:hypothetical protein
VDYTVDVTNTTTTSGLAGRVLEATGTKGWTKGTPNTVKTVKPSTVIQYAAGGQEAALRLAADLGGTIKTEELRTLPAKRLQVMLGKGYTGLGATATPGTSASTPSSSSTPSSLQPSTPAITGNGVPCVN